MKGRGGGEFQDWRELRSSLIDQWGAPHPETEQEIIDAYAAHPRQIEEAALSISADVATGTIRSGWAVLKTRAARITAPPSNPTRSSGVDREKRILAAEQWIRNAGVHFDLDSEVQDYLFNEQGLLREHPDLVDRMLHTWAEQRPAGLALERDALERAERWKRQQKEIPWQTASASANSASSLNSATRSTDSVTPSPASTSTDDLTPL